MSVGRTLLREMLAAAEADPELRERVRRLIGEHDAVSQERTGDGPGGEIPCFRVSLRVHVVHVDKSDG